MEGNRSMSIRRRIIAVIFAAAIAAGIAIPAAATGHAATTATADMHYFG
jgi:hypothetical protein